MTTPQNLLYRLSEDVRNLQRLFEPKEEDSIFEQVKQIELQLNDLIVSHQRIENLLNLIAKVMIKENDPTNYVPK